MKMLTNFTNNRYDNLSPPRPRKTGGEGGDIHVTPHLLKTPVVSSLQHFIIPASPSRFTGCQAEAWEPADRRLCLLSRGWSLRVVRSQAGAWERGRWLITFHKLV